MTPGTRPQASVLAVDTSAVEARLRLETAEAIALGRWHTDQGNAAEAEFWTAYVAALFGLLTDRWALMTIALGDMSDD